MEIQYTPKVDADLEAAFTAESCRGLAAVYRAELSGCDIGEAQEREKQADKNAARLFAARYPKMDDRQTSGLLEEMIAYEGYKASELFPLFAKEARHDNAEEIAVLFEEAALLAEERCRTLIRIRDKNIGSGG